MTIELTLQICKKSEEQLQVEGCTTFEIQDTLLS